MGLGKANHTRISVDDLSRNFQEVEPGLTNQEALKSQIAVFIATMPLVLKPVQQELIFPPLLKKLLQEI